VPPGPLFERLDGIGSQVIGKEVDEQQHKDRPSIDVDGNLERGVAFEKSFHNYSMSLRGALFATTLAPHAVQVSNLLYIEEIALPLAPLGLAMTLPSQ
jgi:hypothetical protein